MNAAAEKLFKLLDSDGDGFITREDIAQLCDKLELDEGPDAFYKHLDLLDDPYRAISIDEIFRSGLFDSVGQNDISHTLAVASEHNYEPIFDLMLLLQKVTLAYLRNKSTEIESELQQVNSEKDNLKREMSILIQECEEREKNENEFNSREKYLRSELAGLHQQLREFHLSQVEEYNFNVEDCRVRDRTNTNESYRSRVGSENFKVLTETNKQNHNDEDSPNKTEPELCENCQRYLEDIKNYENVIEQLNGEKKKMNVKVHAADTYLTQVKELENAYRNLEQHTMQMSAENDSILTEYDEMKGNYDELYQKYEELKNKMGVDGNTSNAHLNIDNSPSFTNFTTPNTTGGFSSFAEELADHETRLHFEQLTEDKVFFGNLDKGPLDLNDKLDLNVTRIQCEELQSENSCLLEKIKRLEKQVEGLDNSSSEGANTGHDDSHQHQATHQASHQAIHQATQNPSDGFKSQESLPDSGFARSLAHSPGPPSDGICGHALIGTAKLFLHCLRHDIGVSYSPPIVDKHGQVFGHLKVKLQRLSAFLSSQATRSSSDTNLIGDLLLGATVTVHIGIIEAVGLPHKLNNYVFCQYKFWDHKDMILPGLEYSHNLPRNKTAAVFEHQETYTVTVTESFLNYVNDGLLSVEVWGLRMDDELESDMSRNSAIITTNATAPLYDRWSEMMTRLQLWVEILEINDSGIYTAVDVQQRSDLKTGGVYQCRQGLSRRILVRVLPVGASGNLACKSISYISIGNVHAQSRHQPALDSYQNEDLLKLRCAWSEALEAVQNRIGEQLHALTEKETLTDEEEEERGKLLEEWIRLLRERDAVLLPKDNSGVPGAKDSRAVPIGMENRIPTLFVNVQDELKKGNNNKSQLIIGENSNLSGQDQSAMTKLTTVKHDQHRVCAIAAWDSSVHESVNLNCVTEPEQRIYLTLQVGVEVALPYGLEMELVLRKRVCVRVYKKRSLRDSMRNLIQDVPKRCGVMCEIVTGIPLFSTYAESLGNSHNSKNPGADSSTPIKSPSTLAPSMEGMALLDNDPLGDSVEVIDLEKELEKEEDEQYLSERDDSIDPLPGDYF